MLAILLSFSRDNFYPTDIDECSEGTDRCSQNCHNTVGSYTCSCSTGYRLNADGVTCDGKYNIIMQNSNSSFAVLIFNFALHTFLDIDECAEGTDRCAQNCHNNVGSYYCSCNSGYRLNINGYNCDGMAGNSINMHKALLFL